ncbi:MAG: 6,7-dimethyl-8-ribityllumazine synthase [Planctomycetaceae bacterium]
MAQRPSHRFEGTLPAAARFAIVVARFNEEITSKLLEGALDTLREYDVADDRVFVAHVPGAFEIPMIADRLAKSGRFAAVLCLGAVIKGETPHDEYINRQVASGIARAARESGVPVIFGVLTCLTREQALDRAGGKVGNKGSEAALAAIEMIDLIEKLRSTVE